MEKDSYRVPSRYYDAAYASLVSLDDIPCHTALAERAGGPVLEIGQRICHAGGTEGRTRNDRMIDERHWAQHCRQIPILAMFFLRSA